MILSSKSNYFQQSQETLSANREILITYLVIKKFDRTQRDIILKAYDYFVENPHRYDGATMSQDLFDLPRNGMYDGLEIAAMVHDYIYIYLQANLSHKAMKVADQIMKSIMIKTNKSGFEIGRRMFLLKLVNRPFAWYNRFKTGNRITAAQMAQIQYKYYAFAKA